MATTFRKRSSEDHDSLSSFSFNSSNLDPFTPPEKRRFIDVGPTTTENNIQQEAQREYTESVSLSVTQRSIASYNSPPPSPLKHIHKLRTSPNSLEDSEEWEITERPPHGITPKDYDKAISVRLSSPVRLNQLIIWSVQEAIKRKQSTLVVDNWKNSNSPQSAIELKADQIALNIQTRIMQGLLNGKIQTYRHKGRSDTVKQRNPHPGNILNQKRLKKLKEHLERLQKEENEWKEVKSKLFHQHAAILDDKTPKTVPITRELLDELDDHQKEFLDQYCQDDSNAFIPSKSKEDMAIEISDMRQRLATAEKFQKCIKKYCNDMMVEISHNLERGATLVDQGSVAKVSDIEGLKEFGKDAEKDVLRMLSRYTN